MSNRTNRKWIYSEISFLQLIFYGLSFSPFNTEDEPSSTTNPNSNTQAFKHHAKIKYVQCIECKSSIFTTYLEVLKCKPNVQRKCYVRGITEYLHRLPPGKRKQKYITQVILRNTKILQIFLDVRSKNGINLHLADILCKSEKSEVQA